MNCFTNKHRQLHNCPTFTVKDNTLFFVPVLDKAWGRCWYRAANTETAPPVPSHSQRPDTVSPHESSLHLPCRFPVRGNQGFTPETQHQVHLKQHNNGSSHLHLERTPLYFRDTLGDDEGDAVTGTAGYLREVSAKQLQAALQLLVTTLDGQSLQTAFVTCQETLRTQEKWSVSFILKVTFISCDSFI